MIVSIRGLFQDVVAFGALALLGTTVALWSEVLIEVL